MAACADPIASNTDERENGAWLALNGYLRRNATSASIPIIVRRNERSVAGLSKIVLARIGAKRIGDSAGTGPTFQAPRGPTCPITAFCIAYASAADVGSESNGSL